MLPIGGGVVVAVPEPRVQAAGVELLGAQQPDLLHRRQHQLDAGVRPALADEVAHRAQHRGHGRLVVGAEDRRLGVHHAAVLDHRLDRRRRRHGVQVGVQEQRVALGGGLDPAVDVADVRADRRARAVLVRLQPELAEEADRQVGDPALLARRAGHRSQAHEQVERREVGERHQRQAVQRAAPRAQVADQRLHLEAAAGRPAHGVLGLLEVAAPVHVLAHPAEHHAEVARSDPLLDVRVVGLQGLPQHRRVQVAQRVRREVPDRPGRPVDVLHHAVGVGVAAARPAAPRTRRSRRPAGRPPTARRASPPAPSGSAQRCAGCRSPRPPRRGSATAPPG